MVLGVVLFIPGNEIVAYHVAVIVNVVVIVFPGLVEEAGDLLWL